MQRAIFLKKKWKENGGVTQTIKQKDGICKTKKEVKMKSWPMHFLLHFQSPIE